MSVCIEPECEADKFGRQSRCKRHHNEKLRDRYRNDPEYRADLLARQRQRGTTPMRRCHLPAKIEEQHGRCAICGEDIPQGKGLNHVDHRVPRSRGGSDEAANIQAVCAPCNRRKGVKQMDELLAQTMLPFPVS